MTPVVEMQSPNHWTTRQVPGLSFYFIGLFLFIYLFIYLLAAL